MDIVGWNTHFSIKISSFSKGFAIPRRPLRVCAMRCQSNPVNLKSEIDGHKHELARLNVEYERAWRLTFPPSFGARRQQKQQQAPHSCKGSWILQGLHKYYIPRNKVFILSILYILAALRYIIILYSKVSIMSVHIMHAYTIPATHFANQLAEAAVVRLTLTPCTSSRLSRRLTPLLCCFVSLPSQMYMQIWLKLSSHSPNENWMTFTLQCTPQLCLLTLSYLLFPFALCTSAGGWHF
jgi:hypothetical protein